MRLRWLLVLAFSGLLVLQGLVVVPLALRDLGALLNRQHEARAALAHAAASAEVTRLGTELGRTMQELAESAALEDVARDAAQSPPASHVTRSATALMTPRGLDVLAILDETGRTLSSGHLPARLGEADDPLFAVTRLSGPGPHLVSVDVQGEESLVPTVAAAVARPVDYGDRRVWIVGGFALNDARAKAVAQVAQARVELWRAGQRIAGYGPTPLQATLKQIPLSDGAQVQVIVSRDDVAATRTQVWRGFAALFGLGLLAAFLASVWVSRRITGPLEALTDAARQIGEGKPGAKVQATAASQELALLIATFDRMTDDLKQATDRLLASERVAAWQEVARRLAHEIKNPLTPIRMSLETLSAMSQRGQRDDRFHRLFDESAKAMLEEVDRLKRIVDEFSQFARLPKPVLARVDLAELVRRVMALYAAHDGVHFVVDAPGPAWIDGDRDQLTQVLVNLVKNAEEAMQQRTGAVTVRVAAVGGLVSLDVEDQGPGVPADLRARLFEPYVTSKPNGTGLGLAIAQRIAHEHAGRLEVLDGPGGGALFRLAVPGQAAPSDR